MTRIKNGVTTRKRHGKILKLNRGFLGSHSKLYVIAKQQKMRALQYSYKHRAKRQIFFKSLWIKKINGIIKELRLQSNIEANLNYNKLMKIYINNFIFLNTKTLVKISKIDKEGIVFLIKLAIIYISNEKRLCFRRKMSSNYHIYKSIRYFLDHNLNLSVFLDVENIKVDKISRRFCVNNGIICTSDENDSVTVFLNQEKNSYYHKFIKKQFCRNAPKMFPQNIRDYKPVYFNGWQG